MNTLGASRKVRLTWLLFWVPILSLPQIIRHEGLSLDQQIRQTMITITVEKVTYWEVEVLFRDCVRWCK